MYKNDDRQCNFNTKYNNELEKLPKIICDANPDWVKMYYLAWETAFSNIEYPKKEGWLPQMTCMPGMGMIWQWDSCFMTFISNYSNGTISALNNLDNLYSVQREDGYLCMAYYIETGEPCYESRINPPLLAWAEWQHFLISGDNSRFERVLPSLVKYYNWIKANRRRNNGLYWFEDSGSSGMDNSPRGVYFSTHLDGSDVSYIDLICQQALSAYCISKIAANIQNYEIERQFIEEYKDLYTLINKHHWNEKTGFYYDLFTRHNKHLKNNYVNHKTVAGFWPIISGVADNYQVNKLIEHLVNPDEFMTPHPVPTISKDDPNYNPLGGYWLGSVWAPTNYMIVKGLRQRKRYGLAREIAIKHLNAMML